MTDDEKEILAILDLIEKSVNMQDYDAVRSIIPDDSEMFGSFEPVMVGFNEMADKQFHKVWPRIGTFRMDEDSKRVKSNGTLGYASNFFHTRAELPDGSIMERTGRMSWVFEKRADRWQIIHSHDSLVPTRSLTNRS